MKYFADHIFCGKQSVLFILAGELSNKQPSIWLKVMCAGGLHQNEGEFCDKNRFLGVVFLYILVTIIPLTFLFLLAVIK